MQQMSIRPKPIFLYYQRWNRVYQLEQCSTRKTEKWPRICIWHRSHTKSWSVLPIDKPNQVSMKLTHYVFSNPGHRMTQTDRKNDHITSILLAEVTSWMHQQNKIRVTLLETCIRNTTAVDWCVSHLQLCCGEIRSLNIVDNVSLPCPSSQHCAPAADSLMPPTDTGYRCMLCQPGGHPADLAQTSSTNNLLIDLLCSVISLCLIFSSCLSLSSFLVCNSGLHGIIRRHHPPQRQFWAISTALGQ